MKFKKEMEKFVKADDVVVSVSAIESIDFSDIESLIAKIRTISGREHVASGILVLELAMQTRPSVLEGKRLMWAKGVWSFHNLVAHPVMQILAFFGFYKAAFAVHDATVPRAFGKRLGKAEAD